MLHVFRHKPQKSEDKPALCVDHLSQVPVRPGDSFSCFWVLIIALRVLMLPFLIKSFLKGTSSLLPFQGTYHSIHITDVHVSFSERTQFNPSLPSGTQKALVISTAKYFRELTHSTPASKTSSKSVPGETWVWFTMGQISSPFEFTESRMQDTCCG